MGLLLLHIVVPCFGPGMPPSRQVSCEDISPDITSLAQRYIASSIEVRSRTPIAG